MMNKILSGRLFPLLLIVIVSFVKLYVITESMMGIIGMLRLSYLMIATGLGLHFFIKLANKTDWFSQPIRDDGPKTHLVKKGTPTMGGAILILVLASYFWLFPSKFTGEAKETMGIFPYITELSVLFAFGLIGLVDDWLKIKHSKKIDVRKNLFLHLTLLGLLIGLFFLDFTKHSLLFVGLMGVLAIYSSKRGLNVKTKLLVQCLAVYICLPFLHSGSPQPLFFIDYEISGWMRDVSLGFFIIGFANAVNLTDGMDGLVTSLLLIPFCMFWQLLDPLLIFLLFNSHPAKVFMGDTGSLGFGALLGMGVFYNGVFGLALSTLFAVNALSVMIQVVYYKRTKKRLFLMAPLHHHFELKGYSEKQVVYGACAIQLLIVLVSVVWIIL